MGTYKETCAISYIDINRGDEVALLLLNRNNNNNKNSLSNLYSTNYFTPAFPPIFGKYDDYGCIEPNSNDTTLEFLSKTYDVSPVAFLEAISSGYDAIYMTIIV